MNKLILISIAAIALAGCSKIESFDVTDRHCEKSTTEQRAKFTLSCIANANPLSDEEPEDWIKECAKTSESLYCPIREHLEVRRYFGAGGYEVLSKTLKEPLEGDE